MICAALDYSWNEAVFAVTDGGKLLASKRIMLEGHDSSMLASSLRACLQESGIPSEKVESWSVGTGPGGFTGMRVASALVSGFVYGRKNVKFRGVPTAFALARSAWKGRPLPSRILSLFDGRHRELLAYGMRTENGSCFADGFTAVLRSPAELEILLQKTPYCFTALEKDREPVRAFDPGLENKVLFVPGILPEELIFNDPGNTSTSPTDLIYLREAVFVAPKVPRVLA